MNITHVNVHPPKLTLTVIGVVVGLHVLTGMALVMVTPPVLAIKVPKVVPPIEIQFIDVPVEIEKPVIEEMPVRQIEKPEPVTVKEPLPDRAIEEPKPQTVAELVVPEKPKLVEKVPPKSSVVEPTPPKIVEKEPVVTPTKTVKQPPPVSTVSTPTETDTIAKQHEILVAQAQAAANERAILQAQAEQQAADDAKAARDAQAKVDAQAKAAASNTPVNFSSSDANWVSRPNFNFPDRARRNAQSGDAFSVGLVLRVNKQGGIDSVSLARSSGNIVLDREAQRQVRSGKFRPFTKDNVPVVGNLTLTINYEVS